LAGTFEIRRVVDVDLAVARDVGERAGARYGTDVTVLWDDAAIEVVAVCSPHSFHAAQVSAACESGKLAVLCEKPLCVTLAEAHVIRDVSLRTGVPVVTGTMHLFDPAFTAAAAVWGSAVPDLVRSVCLLPSNQRFIDLATELAPSAPAPGPAPVPDLLESEILGLASHHLPLVRRFMPELDQVIQARPLAPWGYDVTLSGGGTIAQMIGMMPIAPSPRWTFEAACDKQCLSIEFPPSYVQTGSARATLHGDPTRTWRYPANGYVAEWEVLARVARGAEGSHYLREAIADFEWARRIIAAAAPPKAGEKTR